MLNQIFVKNCAKLVLLALWGLALAACMNDASAAEMASRALQLI